MKLVLGKWAVDRVAAAATRPQDAAQAAIDYLYAGSAATAASSCSARDGRFGLAHNTPRMAWGLQDLRGREDWSDAQHIAAHLMDRVRVAHEEAMNDTLSSPGSPQNQMTGCAHIHRLLLGYFGEQKPREPWDPLSQFIYSLLSSRTKTETTYQVVRHLRERFGTWENLRDASLAEIEDAIRDVTFPEQKAVQFKASLEGITQRYGSLTLDFLARYRTDKIRAWLEQFPGVGPKTSAAVVNFSSAQAPCDVRGLAPSPRDAEAGAALRAPTPPRRKNG